MYSFLKIDDVYSFTPCAHCNNPVVPTHPVWAYYVHERQRRCQDDPVSLSSGRLEKTPRSSPHHVAQHRPTGSETTPPYAPRSSRFGSELPPSVEDDVDVWCYAMLELHARNDDNAHLCTLKMYIYFIDVLAFVLILPWFCASTSRSHTSFSFSDIFYDYFEAFMQ